MERGVCERDTQFIPWPAERETVLRAVGLLAPPRVVHVRRASPSDVDQARRFGTRLGQGVGYAAPHSLWPCRCFRCAGEQFGPSSEDVSWCLVSASGVRSGTGGVPSSDAIAAPIQLRMRSDAVRPVRVTRRSNCAFSAFVIRTRTYLREAVSARSRRDMPG